MTLEQIYQEAAIECRKANIAIDASPCGAIHKWVKSNVAFRPGTEFFIVCGIASAMADMEAREQGFKDQFDRALSRVNFKK